MNHHTAQVPFRLTVNALSKFLFRTTVVIVLLAVLITGLASHVMARASEGIPPGFSSEIIQVKFQEGTEVDASTHLLPEHLLSSVDSITRLYNLSKEYLDKMRREGESRSGKDLPDLNLWFKIVLTPDANASDFIESLQRLNSVEHVQAAPLPPLLPATTPDFTELQGYLGPATDGIDSIFSSTIPGGNGNGVKIYDVEYSWNQTHEDLSKAHGVSLLLNPGDTAVDPFSDNNHGTAVLGELIANNDSKGVTGISWGADIGLAPANTANLGYNPANAILLAMADGLPGDVILIEQQITVCGLPSGSFGPSEWILSVFNAIQTAVANGFVVVEAAGNGNVNLDQLSCNAMFDRTVRDSGAIIVGAGAPPGSSDRQRLSFSSYGSRVDVQGWGRGVMTTGYGTHYTNPDDPTNPDFFYRSTFSGTSSASPFAAGAAANLQGIALNQSGTPLSPLEIRTLLVETGSPQLGDTTENIGPRPDLRRAIAEIISPSQPLITITAIATGNPEPGTATFPANVMNGDFLITGSERHPRVGDGRNERTTWTFIFARHPNFPFLPNFISLESALLTLTLEPKTRLITTDSLKIDGLPAINMTPLIQGLPVDITTTIQLELLDFFSSSELLEVLKATPDGRLGLTYQDDSIVSFARLDIGSFPPTGAPSCVDLFDTAPGFIPCGETVTTCTFNAFTNGGTCDDICTSLGSQCISADDNATAGCTPIPGSTDTCQTPRQSEICTCAR